jgi:hypothetical protein
MHKNHILLVFSSHVNNFNPNMLRSKVGALLAEVPNGRLQVFLKQIK